MKHLKNMWEGFLDILEAISFFLSPHKFRHDPTKTMPWEQPSRKERRKQKQQEKQKERALKKHNNKKKKDKKDNDKTVKKIPENVKQTSTVKEKKISPLEALMQSNATPTQEKTLGVEVMDISEPLTNDKAKAMLQTSESNLAYHYHDGRYHQIAVRFKPKSLKDEYRARDDVARKNLKPRLFPNPDKMSAEYFDRTHVIPIGYHGSEDDNRLLVGFNSDINRKDLRDFEIMVGNFNKTQTIMWFVSIEKQDNESAKWYATVWNKNGKVLVKDTFHDKDEFVWLP